MRSYKLGVNGYVVKPVGFGEFIKAMADLGIFWAGLEGRLPGSAEPCRRLWLSQRGKPG